MAKKALYLAGGGARGAYQAGVLKAIAHILQVKTLPFEMVSGVSIGSINASILAQHADDFPAGIEKLETLWREIRCQNIFNTSNYELGKSVVRNISHLIIKQRQSGHLLDTTPLHDFINKHINFTDIKTNITNGHLETMEVISNCYETQQTISFYQHNQPFDDWHYPRHISQRVEMDMEYILASSALPLFFPTVKINGFHYGDGSMGLVSPLRGAVRFNVEKILILGTRQLPVFMNPEKLRNGDIGFAHILGNMLNGLFLDNLDRDIEMVNRMNDIAQLLSMWKKRHSPWRPIETLHLRPSVDIAAMAQAQYQAMPGLLRFLLNVLGAQSHSGDLLSFLLFEKEFTCELIDLGYQDTLASEATIQTFFA
ncbi:patatin-like phospholipase family protein [Legionella oakridgensis]|uniref:Alpha-beta hydrolase family transporter esterase n=2 Tax=Legionella oakridgensis TaxID=29423 RepID=A0A0W0X4M4_9GAMM|nr:patatin-like phospholipase family protein [Legionella oakridgensis]AHE68280.1 putative esterase of the alpha-beta hydrolase superfamily [Legionella oakridgensis ATCC 33761 = DSM 21215]ETO92244.1 putative esterase of the alpha-beta hydrolase superfamily [Legionella oakridgensis RV-2-2007]KTD39532.1 alpha-beta hydrolase family transporter esterase [Legionella oakridgensis]STY21232.1 patatin family protein [Legionella longbeachae]